MIFCRSCGRVWPAESVYCGNCGKTFNARICPDGHTNPMFASVCLTCGSRKLTDGTKGRHLSWMFKLAGVAAVAPILGFLIPVIVKALVPIVAAAISIIALCIVGIIVLSLILPGSGGIFLLLFGILRVISKTARTVTKQSKALGRRS